RVRDQRSGIAGDAEDETAAAANELFLGVGEQGRRSFELRFRLFAFFLRTQIEFAFVSQKKRRDESSAANDDGVALDESVANRRDESPDAMSCSSQIRECERVAVVVGALD